VFLSEIDLEALYTAFHTSRKDFIRTYCREVPISGHKRLSLQEKANFDCIFWKEGGCIVYENRPLQCRSYPFWKSHLGSRDQWEELKAFCPGIDTGSTHDRAKIEEWLDQRDREPLILLPD
jgi:Fe-S-cluster containining protein